MKKIVDEKMNLIGNAYKQYHEVTLAFVARRINDSLLAEDMVQDVFIRLVDNKDMLREKTIKSFIFTIAQNILIDYFRRRAKRIQIHSYLYDKKETEDNTIFDKLSVDNILKIEKDRISKLPKMRKEVYNLSRFEGLSSKEISERLNLNYRTVESHLFLGRKEIREYISKICG